MSGEPSQRKLILYMSMSLDGFAARRDGTMDWRINVQPVALGNGLPLLHGLHEPLWLQLVSSTAWADGPITQTYIPR